MDGKCIDDYGDILYLHDVMKYLQIGRDTARILFKDPAFPALNIDNRRFRVLKVDFIKFLAEMAS